MIIGAIKPSHPTLPDKVSGVIINLDFNAEVNILHLICWIVCPIKVIRISLPPGKKKAGNL
jgi:hypothetical protein